MDNPYAIKVNLYCGCDSSGVEMKEAKEQFLVFFCPNCGKRQKVTVETIDT